MRKLKQGDIYLVRWDPSVGHEFQKTRPGVVVSSEVTLAKTHLVSLMALTSSGDSLEEDILLEKNTENRLMKDSVIKVHHVSSFDSQRLVHYIGSCGDSIMLEIREYLKIHFGL